MRSLAPLVFVAGLVCGSALAQGAPNDDPDWPCVQRKVPTLSPASVWTGPPIEDVAQADLADPKIEALVSRLPQRRLSDEDVEAAIAAYAAGLPADEREVKLTALFAGLFAALDGERGEVMEGIDRYARNQKAMAERLRNENSALNEMREKTSDFDPQVLERREALDFDIRLFEERRRSLSYVCEVPRLIEQRLYVIARAIDGAME